MNKHIKILLVILLSLFIAYSLFGLNALTLIFWAGVLYVGYALLLLGMRIERERELKEYNKKHKTTFNTYENLYKCLKSSILIMPHLKKKLTLPNVTLLSATSTEMEEAQIGKW